VFPTEDAILPPCYYDEQNLRWSGKAILNSIGMDLWEALEKYLSDEPSGVEVFTAVVTKLQFINASTVRQLTQDLQSMQIRNEPGENVEDFCNKVNELARRIEGSGMAPMDLSTLVIGTFLSSSVPEFKLKVMQFHDKAEMNPEGTSWSETLKVFKSKYNSLKPLKLWGPLLTGNSNRHNELAALTAKVERLVQTNHKKNEKKSQEKRRKTPKCYNCGGNHYRNNCPDLQNGQNY
jgi:hypothetical protein